MKRKLGVAIVGCGMIAGFHLRAFRNIPRVEICGVWNGTAEAAERFAGSNRTNAYPSFEELLADKSLDLVDICLPSGLHAEYGCRAAQSGKHVVVEKPVDVSLEAAGRLIKTCEEAGVFLAAVLQNRFAPSVSKVKQALEQNLLGKIIAGEATVKWYRENRYYQSSNWKGTKRLDGGGALINQSIHTIDLLLWFLGNVKSVASLVRTARHSIEVEDLAVAIAEFENGAVASVTGSTALKPGFPERIELYGEKGAIALEAGRIVRWKVDDQREEDFLDQSPSNCASADPSGISIENHQRQFEAITGAILKGEQPPVSGTEALRSLKFILDVYAANEGWVRK